MSHRSLATIEAPKPDLQPAKSGALDRLGVAQLDSLQESAETPRPDGAICAAGLDLSPAPPPPPTGPKWRFSGDFTATGVHTVSRTIRDDDAGRALLTDWLLHELAPLLGLDASRIEVRVNSEAESRTDARGAEGLMASGTILLHPDRYDPDTREGRYLLAHEAVHVAQRNPAADAESIPEAEHEADQIARAFAEGRQIERPQHQLPVLAVAANNDVLDNSDEPIFDATAAANRNRELSMIKGWLGGLWVSDGDVANILTLLSSLPKATAIALVRALKRGERYDLLNNFNKHHFKPFREQVLLVYQATPANEINEKFDEDLLVDIPMFELSNDEAFAIDHVFQSLKDKYQRKIRASKVGKAIDEVTTYVTDPAHVLQHEDDYQRSIAEETKEQDSLKERKSKAQQALKDENKGPLLKRLIEQIRQTLSKFWIKDADALGVLALIEPYASDPGSLQAIVDGLVELKEPPKDDPGRYQEKKNYLDVLLDEIPVEKLYDPASRRLHVLVRLMSYRPPYKNMFLAQKLINATFSNSEDAFLAFHLVKALPEREQKAFLTSRGGETWSNILSGLSLSQREALSVNLYNGGKDQGDRNSILLQLMQDQTWANPPRLSGLIRMAIAAGHYAWVFAESERRIKEDPARLSEHDFLVVVEKYGLYNPRNDARRSDGTTGPRVTFDPAAYKTASYKGKHWYEEGPWGWIGSKIFGGLDFLGKSSGDVAASLFRKSMGAKGANIAEAQDIFSGDFMGATFERQENLGMAGSEAMRKKQGINFADDMKWDRNQGVLQMSASELAIANLHFQRGNIKLEADRGSISALEVNLRYATEDNPGPSLIDIYAGEVDLEDVVLILPASMYGANEATLGGLRVLSRESGSDPANDPKPREGLLALGFGVFANVFGAKGSGEELAENLLKPNTPMEVDVTFDSIKVKSLTTSSGQHIRSLDLKDFKLLGGGTAASYRKALELSKLGLETRIARETRKASAAPDPTAQNKVIAQLEKHLRTVTEELGEFAVIDDLEERKRKHQEDPNSPFSEADSNKLAKMTAKMASGMVMELGSISAEGIEGLPIGQFKAENIHGQGRPVGALFGTGTFSQILQGGSTIQPSAPPRTQPLSEANFKIDIGHLESSAVDIQGSIPTPEDAKKDLDRLLKNFDPSEPGQDVKHQQLQHRLDVATAYDALLAKGAENLTAEERTKLFALLGELQAYEAAHAFHVGKLAVEGASLTVADTGQLSAHADAITADDIHEAGSDTSIETITGSNLNVSANVEGGLFGLAEWRKNIKGGKLAAGQLDFSNIRHAGSGTVVKSLGLRGAEASGDRGGPITLKARSIDVANVSVTVTRKLLLAERELLLSVPSGAFLDRDRKKLEAIDKALSELDGLDKTLATAAAALDKAKAAGKPGPLKKAETAFEAAQKARTAWQEQLVVKGLSIQDLDIVVEGIGDVLSEDFNFEAALRKGITIRGGNAGGQMISGATLTDSHIPGFSGKEIKLGRTGGSVTVSEKGVELNGFFIDSLAVTGLDYQGGGNHLWSKGTSRLTKLRVNARTENREKKDKDGISQWELARITLTSLDIEKVEAGRLGYSSNKSGFQVELDSGSIDNIHAENFLIDLPEKETDPVKVSGNGKGKASIGKLHQLRLHGAIGKSLSAKGVLSGSDLRAELYGDSAQKFHIGDFSVEEGEVSNPSKGSVKFSVSHLSGEAGHRLTKAGDVFDINNLQLKVLKLDKGSTWADDGTKLEILGSASVTNLRATAQIRRKKVGPDRFQIEQVTIPDLSADQIDAQDVHVTIAARAADEKAGIKAQPAKTVTLKSATITGFTIVGFDLLKQVGTISTESMDVKDLGLQIASKGEKAFKEAHLSVKGTGLSGTLSGPSKDVPGGKFSLDLGHIESLSGSYSDNQSDIQGFSAQDLTGKAEFGPDFVHVFDLNAGPVKFGHCQFTDSINKVALDGMNVSAVHLVDLQANFAADPNDPGNKERTLSSLVLKSLVFDKIVADNFSYDGNVTDENKAKQTETTHRNVKAQKAVLEPFTIEELNLDILKHTQHVKADIGKVSLTGFTGAFDTKVAGNLVKQTSVAADVIGENLSANLDFASVKLADGADWTQMSGTFHLGKLGLLSPSVNVTEFEAGKEKSKFALSTMGLDKQGIDLTGLNATFAPNGTVLINFDDLIAHGLKINAAMAGKTIDLGLPMAEIKGAAVGLKGLFLKDGIEVLGAQAQKITTHGLKVDIDIDRKVTPTASGASAKPEPFVIEPLAGAEGTMILTLPVELFEGFDIPLESLSVPVHKGEIDLEKANLEGLLGNEPKEKDEDKDKKDKDEEEKKYTISLDEDGILVTRHTEKNIFGGKKWFDIPVHIPTTKGRPGLDAGRGKNGTIVVEPFLESYLNEPSDPTKPGPTDLGVLNHVGLEESNFQLGTGMIGTKSNFIKLSGSEPGSNLVHIIRSVLGKDLSLEMSKLNAAGAGFTVTENEGTPEQKQKAVTTGAIAFTNVKVSVKGLANSTFTFSVTLRTDDGVIDGVAFGDVSLLKAETLAKEKGPELKEETKEAK